MNIDTKWIKTGKPHDFVFLGNDVIATASGNHVLFYNLVSKEKHIEYFNSATRGDGVSCLAGHPIIPIFCTAERCCKPKIYIHTYPEMKKVAECKSQKSPNIYLSCSFTGTEYLLSLTSYLNFEIAVWLWRTGQKIASIDSNIRSDIQIIESSVDSFNLLYQFAPKLGRLLTYEIHTYSKNVSIIKNEVDVVKSQIKSVCWIKNGNLLLSDKLKNVYIVSNDGKKLQCILSENTALIEDDNCLLVVPIYAGFITADSNSELKYYSKSIQDVDTSNSWSVTWTIKCISRPLKIALARHAEVILIYCENGQIFELHLTQGNKPELEEIFNDCPKFKFLGLIRPQETQCLLVNESNGLTVINNFDGNVNGTLKINPEDQVHDIATHPSLPLIVASTSSGKCIYITESSGKLEVVKTIRLQREALNSIKFCESGSAAAVVSTITNIIFLTATVVGQDIDVFVHITLEKCIVDFLMYDERDDFMLLTLVRSLDTKAIGNIIEIYKVNKLDKVICKTCKVYMHSYYSSLEYGLKNVNNFLGIPYLSKQLHILKIKDDYTLITLEYIGSSDHNLRKFNVYTADNYFLFSGYDGNIILKRSSELAEIVNTYMVHHYQEKGILKSVFSIQNNTIVSLGKNGSVVGLQFCDLYKETDVRVSKKSKNIQKLSWNQVRAENLSPNTANQIWLEQKAQEEYQKMADEILDSKNLISQKLQSLKLQIKRLLDINESKFIDFQLPISVFDIATEIRRQKIEIATREREERGRTLQATIDRNKEIIDYLIIKFCKSLKVHDCTIASFDAKILVTNFSLLREEREKIYDSSIELFNTPKSNSLVKYGDDKNDELAISEGVSNMRIADKSSEVLNDYFLLHYGNDIAFAGSTSCKWINDIPPNQLTQPTSEIIHHDYFSSREYKLKVTFNEEFEAMKNLKTLVLEKTTERVQKLSHCKNELKNLFNIVVEDDLTETTKQFFVASPEVTTLNSDEDNFFHENLNDSSDENKEQDSGKSQNLGKESKATLSNDEYEFREKKLYEMMDGSLEIRWEDEVKKDIPKPTCLLLKSPSMYDDKDVDEIKNYQAKVKQLEDLRLKYKSHLETEICHLKQQIEKDVESFDKKMEEFSLKKINVKSAVLQEFLLRFAKQKHRFLKDFKDRNVVSAASEEMAGLEEEHKCLADEINEVEVVLIELKGKYESLIKRDKIFEGKFKGEFNEMKQPLVDHLSRQYKRRPRIAQITCTSLTFLTETAKCLMAGKKSSILPRDYLDFLRGMDALDVMPSSLPPQIDANHWQLLCKLRRNKVEIEIKLRIAALEVAEAEQTFFHLQKLISSSQSKLMSMKTNIDEVALKQSRSSGNPEIQLVLKSAQMEIPTTGHVCDLENAIVVLCKQLIEVSSDIVNRGNEKIKAMRKLVNVKRSIVFRNWKYEFLVKKIKHLKEHLSTLRTAKIGKKMQKYLINRLEGNTRCKDRISCEKMLRSVNKNFEKMERAERSNLLKLIGEVKNWHKANAELMRKIDMYLLEKQEMISILEGNSLLRKNQVFHEKIIRMIRERTQLVENVKDSFDKITNLNGQLDLLKFKTYPILRPRIY